MNEKDLVVETEEEAAPEAEIVELSLDQLANIGGGGTVNFG